MNKLLITGFNKIFIVPRSKIDKPHLLFASAARETFKFFASRSLVFALVLACIVGSKTRTHTHARARERESFLTYENL